MPKNTLFLIDVQNSFHPGGSLAVPNSDEDVGRIIQFITKNSSKINQVICTLDTHDKLHIAHPGFWVSCSNSCSDKSHHPNPFTLIKNADVGTLWKPREDLKLQNIDFDYSLFENGDSLKNANGTLNVFNYAKEYTKSLEKRGKFELVIWPEHCLKGTAGHNIVPSIREALLKWEQSTGSYVKFVEKGDHPLTENYSIFQADVPVNRKTSFNHELLSSLLESTKVWICGQALTHCVNYTLRDMVEHWPKPETGKIVLLEDCCSSIPSFEMAAETLLDDMKEAGIQITTAEAATNEEISRIN